MRLPYLQSVQMSMAQGNSFQGYRREPFGSVSAFWDMQNMTGKDAPIIRTRDKRYRVCQIADCKGVFGREKIGYADRNTLVYDGVLVGELKNDLPKTFVHMGAYTLIFPDKMIFNTHTGELSNMEHVKEDVNCVYYPCDMLGEDADAKSATYVRLEQNGIGVGFKSKDVVQITGSISKALNGTRQIQTVLSDNAIVIAATLEENYAGMGQGSGMTISRTAPDMDFVTECDNRVWGCNSEKHEVYACKLGDPTNWHNYQGLADDAYALTVGSVGDFTGAATHLGYVYFFKDNVHHKLFGNKPSNYQLTNSHVRGVEAGSEQSLCILNETMYYHSPDGMCASGGALPQSIDAALGGVRYRNVKCGAARGRMWAAMEDMDGGHHLFTYEEDTGVWHREDGVNVKAFAAAGNDLYMVTADGVLWCLTGEGSENLRDGGAQWEDKVPFAVETGDLDMADLFRKRLQKIHMRLTLEDDATCKVLVQYDGGDWKKLAEIESGKDLTSKVIPFVPRRCDRMRIRLEGTGMMKLYNLNTITTGGSEIG